MSSISPRDITQLLLAWNQGEEKALDRLVPVVYAELRRLAHRYMRQERADHTLQTTALVHEAYQRLIHSSRVQWQNRAHFFAISAQLMRRVLVDFARARRYQKRGGEALRVSLDAAGEVACETGKDLVAVDDALSALSAVDSRKAKVVELRFFGGLSVEEAAEVLKVSPDTVIRDWRLAKVWLLNELRGGV